MEVSSDQQSPTSGQDNQRLSSLKIGDHYLVKRNDHTWQAAEILQIKANANQDMNQEYYVHYDGCDRRLDEWVTNDRIDVHASLKKRKQNKATQQGGQSRRKVTRKRKKMSDETNHVQKAFDEMGAGVALLEKEHEVLTKVKYIDMIQCGKYEIDAWYFSPYFEECDKLAKLWICEYCLKYMRFRKTYQHHLSQCDRRHPPGSEIYCKGTTSVYEVDGRDHKLYCQNLSLLAKLFLDHKAVQYNVEPFLFYILCEVDESGAHVAAYFSKEKESAEGNNVSCILTLPQFQRKGYGRFLIAFSYELSKLEGVIGSPEKPLSDLGKLSYHNYWSLVILEFLRDYEGGISIQELSDEIGIAQNDIITTLLSLNLVKFWKGKYVISVTANVIDQHLERFQNRQPKLTVDPKCLHWILPKERNKGPGT